MPLVILTPRVSVRRMCTPSHMRLAASVSTIPAVMCASDGISANPSAARGAAQPRQMRLEAEDPAGVEPETLPDRVAALGHRVERRDARLVTVPEHAVDPVAQVSVAFVVPLQHVKLQSGARRAVGPHKARQAPRSMARAVSETITVTEPQDSPTAGQFGRSCAKSGSERRGSWSKITSVTPNRAVPRVEAPAELRRPPPSLGHRGGPVSGRCRLRGCGRSGRRSSPGSAPIPRAWPAGAPRNPRHAGSSSTPAAANSCSIQPWPMPPMSRPSLSRSRVASRRARMTGLWKSASSTLSRG